MNYTTPRPGLSSRYRAALTAHGVKLDSQYRTAEQFEASYRACKLAGEFVRLLPSFDTLIELTDSTDTRAAFRAKLCRDDAADAALSPSSGGVGLAVRLLRRGLSELDSAKRSASQRRRVSDSERESNLWKIALHEAAHCAAAFCYSRGVEWARVSANGSGEMLPRGPLTRESDARITAAAWAICSAFGHSGGGLRSDFRQLAKRGVRAVRPGDEYDDAFLSYQESESFKYLRDEIRRDLAQKERAIIAVADELFRRVGEQVSGDELRRVWDSC